MSNNKKLWCPRCQNHRWCGKFKGTDNFKCLKCQFEFKRLRGVYIEAL